MASLRKNPASDSGPSADFYAVTKSDASPIITGGQACRALYIGGAGDVACVNRDGTSVTFVGIPVGTILPVETRQVMSTGTTATNIVALF